MYWKLTIPCITSWLTVISWGLWTVSQIMLVVLNEQYKILPYWLKVFISWVRRVVNSRESHSEVVHYRESAEQFPGDGDHLRSEWDDRRNQLSVTSHRSVEFNGWSQCHCRLWSWETPGVSRDDKCVSGHHWLCSSTNDIKRRLYLNSEVDFFSQPIACLQMKKLLACLLA